MAKEVMLTTIDNEFDPFTQYDSWYQRDLELGYDTCGLLARIARTSDAFTDTENDLIVERAIDEIIKYDPLNVYRKVSK